MMLCRNSIVRDLSVQDNPSLSQGTAEIIRVAKAVGEGCFPNFKQNPFDPRLRTHKIHHLSAFYKKTIYAVWIETDLRSVFYLEGEDIVSVDIGNHAIYRG